MAGFLPKLKVSDFSYELPDSRIALRPVEPRDSSKLLVFEKNRVEHDVFSRLPEILSPDSLLIFNDTKVIPARLHFKSRNLKNIEVFLLTPKNADWTEWEVMIGNRRAFSENEELESELVSKSGKKGKLRVTWNRRSENLVTLTAEGEIPVHDLIELLGEVPLPPYIKRSPEEADKKRYQTIFAREEGAVAAPTASLHFTQELFRVFKEKRIPHYYLTLHVGLGTFKPVTTDFSNEHPMHAERFAISEELITALIDGYFKQITAVGTTAMRVIESLYYIGAASLLGRPDPHIVKSDVGYDPAFIGISLIDALHATRDLVISSGGNLAGETSIYIMPGFGFKLCRGLITNFHQPGSTLLMLVSAFIGDRWKELYREGLEKGYRFLSYGDAMYLVRG